MRWERVEKKGVCVWGGGGGAGERVEGSGVIAEQRVGEGWWWWHRAERRVGEGWWWWWRRRAELREAV